MTRVHLASGVRNTFLYTGDGQRVQIQDSSGTSKQIWDGRKVLLETNALDVTQAIYTSSPGLYGDLVSQRRSGVTAWYAFDPLGSTDRLTDSGQAVTDNYLYKAFGVIVAASGSTTNSWRFVGALGYYYYNQQYCVQGRFVIPTVGRFSSVDPLHPRIADAYAYASNAPVTHVDPSGAYPIYLNWFIAMCEGKDGKPWPPCAERKTWIPLMCCPGAPACGCKCSDTAFNQVLDTATATALAKDLLDDVTGPWQETWWRYQLDRKSNTWLRSKQFKTNLSWQPKCKVHVYFAATPGECFAGNANTGAGGLTCSGSDVTAAGGKAGTRDAFICVEPGQTGCQLRALLLHELWHALEICNGGLQSPYGAPKGLPPFELIPYQISCQERVLQGCTPEQNQESAFDQCMAEYVANALNAQSTLQGVTKKKASCAIWSNPGLGEIVWQ